MVLDFTRWMLPTNWIVFRHETTAYLAQTQFHVEQLIHVHIVARLAEEEN
jgi:hypothetical protein